MNKYFLIVCGLLLVIFGSSSISAQENSSKSDKKDVVKKGKPISIPLPPYPDEARPKKANGTVKVQVTIDETGNVITAKAISGHKLLRPASEKAAMEAKFTPSLSGDKPVKVSAVLVYNFVY